MKKIAARRREEGLVKFLSCLFKVIFRPTRVRLKHTLHSACDWRALGTDRICWEGRCAPTSSSLVRWVFKLASDQALKAKAIFMSCFEMTTFLEERNARWRNKADREILRKADAVMAMSPSFRNHEPHCSTLAEQCPPRSSRIEVSMP